MRHTGDQPATFKFPPIFVHGFIVILLLMLLTAAAHAQLANQELPEISIISDTPTVSEGGIAVFTVRMDRPLKEDLAVFLEVGSNSAELMESLPPEVVVNLTSGMMQSFFELPAALITGNQRENKETATITVTIRPEKSPAPFKVDQEFGSAKISLSEKN